MKVKKINSRVGEKRLMNNGYYATIISYGGCKDVTVLFDMSNETVSCEYSNFKKGLVKPKFLPTVYGVGIVENEKVRDSENNVLKSYKTWQGMLGRCYDSKFKKENPTYEDCSVSEEWKTYSCFKKWYDVNFYQVDSEIMCLDKDILIKGNKMYSKESCVFAPFRINSIFINMFDKNRSGKIGAYKKGSKFMVNIGTTYIGIYESEEEAFAHYKTHREEAIRNIAIEYKNKIPKNLYKALIEYNIEIQD